VSSVDPAAVQQLIARWWFDYDEGRFDAFPELLTEDVHFSCRSDTGATEYEEFIRADVRGRDRVVAWQTDHRRNSPYPLRHNGTNIHITRQSGNEATFASYIFVTQIAQGAVSNLSSGPVTGMVRDEGGVLRIAELNVVLDTANSDVLTSVRTGI
jgi:3-phenylpropionate/cinnamic acid dioxygenase small subunit